ncbi:TIGR01777 family oxidoreductase [Conservatibacter flavescens]|uniref:TIGR01777 family protein n=1 Tax=Conservatibacter flavescens TaxID=28161 RepID=A0A2M8S475_9PAST|nr:TIGR01777 family oxidoreductase [Conservatibacter flavescens]PJG85888.1 TIGR01777 family protein [Conservatibacter flavescens]
MKIFITGATGLIGSALTQALLAQSHEVTVLSRFPEKARERLPFAVNIIPSLEMLTDFNEFDAVINLAGEPIFDHAWSVEQKQKLIQSRLQITKTLTTLINQSSHPPHTFISGSATGYYGDCGEQEIHETHPAGSQFPAQLCLQWEQAAFAANTRVCVSRTGIVLSHLGGAMQKILPLYRLGLGGKIGNGQQYWAWIHLEDMVNGLLFLLHNHHCQGAFNLVAPTPIKNQEFNRTLGQVLKRPTVFTVPAFALKWVLGERAQLVLDSQKILPTGLQEAGFQFQHPQIQTALHAVVS